MKRLKVKSHPRPVLTLTRQATQQERLVYFIVVPRRLRYTYGRSRIAYIGTTRRGIKRIAASAADHANDVLSMRGIRSCEVYIATSGRRPNVATWKQLESAFLLLFRERYGRLPVRNKSGKNIKEGKLFELFTRKRLVGILKPFEK